MTDDVKPGPVLVVDDEPDILVALEDLLEERYRVLKASSPAEALDIIAREPRIAVIVSDQRMPGMTGDVFLERARSLTDAEAILLTGYADLNAVVRAVNQGRIMGYVPKPWDPDLLLATIAGAYERNRLAQELRTERDLLHGLLDHAGGAVSFKDAAGTFVRLNALKAERLGVPVAEALGRAEGDFLDADAAVAVHKADREAITARRPLERTESEEVNGATRWFSVSRIPILDSSGAVTHLMTLERDVTDQRVMEERLRQADKLQALGTLAGGVAHDFNNLLQAILGSLELATKRVRDDDRLTRYLTNASMAAQRGAGLTQRLLSFSRRRELNPQAVDANQIITDMDDLLARTLGGVVSIEKRLAPDLWPAVVDPDQLELAILNLCINARDAMPEGGTLTLSTRNAAVAGPAEADLAPGAYAVIEVADNGTGMTPEVMARVFEPFFTTKDVGKGTGLGLSMVYGLVQQSGGAIRLDSAVGRGTRIELYLPRSSVPAVQPEAETEAAPARARRARILVVDDDPQVRDVTASFLRDLGHDLLEAHNGAEAMTLLERDTRVDLVVADFAMPGMTGIDLAHAVRERAAKPDLPILLVTGYAEMSDAPGNVSILAKPFQQSDLTQRIAELLQGR